MAKKHGKGWKWSEAVLDFDYSDGLKFGRVYPEPQDLDPQIASERETLQKRLDELEILDDRDVRKLGKCDGRMLKRVPDLNDC